MTQICTRRSRCATRFQLTCNCLCISLSECRPTNCKNAFARSMTGTSASNGILVFSIVAFLLSQRHVTIAAHELSFFFISLLETDVTKMIVKMESI
jgi:hypothetical protein